MTIHRGGDSRIIRLTGGDRLAPPTRRASGGIVLPAMQGSGNARMAFGAGGGIVLPAMQGSGNARMAFGAGGDASLAALQGEGTAQLFEPSLITKIGAWLRNMTVGAISSVDDVLTPNPAIQGTPARQPDGNADFSMQWGSGDVLAWPLTSITNATKKLGFAFWMLPASVTATTSTLFNIRNAVGGANLTKFEVRQSSDRITALVYITDANGRQCTSTVATPLSATVPNWVKVFYNADATPEAAKFSITVNTVAAFTLSNIGAGGTIGDLRNATGNLLIGNLNNSGTPSLPYVGKFSRNAYVLTDDLTTEEDTNLRNFEPLAA